jgi:hypothetical protein
LFSKDSEMSNFWLWFSTGIEHITDFNGYDHILFVTLITLAYCFDTWKKLVMMITAFTLGHSISLALSVSGYIQLKAELVEFLIAFSILLTAVYHIVNINKPTRQQTAFLYFVVSFFGLIHGLGFSFLLKAMLGSEESYVWPLVFFNLGLEAGQILIILGVVILNLTMAFLFKVPFKIYKLILVSLIGLVALKITFQRMIELYG